VQCPGRVHHRCARPWASTSGQQGSAAEIAPNSSRLATSCRTRSVREACHISEEGQCLAAAVVEALGATGCRYRSTRASAVDELLDATRPAGARDSTVAWFPSPIAPPPTMIWSSLARHHASSVPPPRPCAPTRLLRPVTAVSRHDVV
jgi:hypothetical protein